MTTAPTDKERFDRVLKDRVIWLRGGPGDLDTPWCDAESASLTADTATAPEQVHVFDEDSVLALRAALAARRPLLVEGETGCGKTQLAYAAAKVLDRPLVSLVVDSRTESSDLLWRFDSVRRLAEAQLCAALGTGANVRETLKVERFIQPGPLWWGLNWKTAQKHCEEYELTPQTVPPGANPENGVVVLIDEIDKGTSDVPNGLLESLGELKFTAEGRIPVEAQGKPPLVIITTNREQTLPAAFIRRCLVYRLPSRENDELISWVTRLAEAHFPINATEGSRGLTSKDVERAAQQLVEDRNTGFLPKPGVAEFLDYLRALAELRRQGDETSHELCEHLRQLTFRKHTGVAR
jgi:MoxR-like ATPase